MLSASIVKLESSGPARMRLMAALSRSSRSRFTFMSSRPANMGSRGYWRFGVTGAALSTNWVTTRTRKPLSATSASRKFARARSSCSPRIAVSCPRLSCFNVAAAATKRFATAFTTAVTFAGSGPSNSSRTKFPSRSELIFRFLPSAFAASPGAVTVNATVRPGRSAALGGTQAKPTSAPTESPGTPRCSTPCPLRDSVKLEAEWSTSSRYMPGRIRSLRRNSARTSESPGAFGVRYSCCSRTTSSSTMLVRTKSSQPEEIGSWPDHMGPGSRPSRAGDTWIHTVARAA